MIRIGFHNCDECNSNDKTLLKVLGRLVFDGEAHIGCGSKIIVNKGAQLELGDNFAISASSTISCYKHIKFGRDIQFSWDCLVMDSDTHAILDEQGNRMNPDKDIVFGNNVWIGGNVTVLPGVTIGDNTIIGAGSVVTKDIPAGVAAVGNPCNN